MAVKELKKVSLVGADKEEYMDDIEEEGLEEENEFEDDEMIDEEEVEENDEFGYPAEEDNSEEM